MAEHSEKNLYCVHINIISSFTPENILLDHTIYIPVTGSSKASVIISNLPGPFTCFYCKCAVSLFLENSSSKRHLYLFEEQADYRIATRGSEPSCSQSKPWLPLGVQQLQLVAQQLFSSWALDLASALHVCRQRQEGWSANQLCAGLAAKNLCGKSAKDFPWKQHYVQQLQSWLPAKRTTRACAVPDSSKPTQLGIKGVSTAEMSDIFLATSIPWYFLPFYLHRCCSGSHVLWQ